MALNEQAFLVLERDNRGIGADNPNGRGTAGGAIPARGVDHPVAVPTGFSKLPGVLHAYKASEVDLGDYAPGG